jgi:hypothetical protein
VELPARIAKTEPVEVDEDERRRLIDYVTERVRGSLSG